MTVTHTYAVLEVSRAAFQEIKEKLDKAGYRDQFVFDQSDAIPRDPIRIDMHGIAIQEEKV